MPTFSQIVPEGDNRLRDVCDTCGYVAYSNPKVVVGSVVVERGQVLLCRRAIEPRRGFWTLPAGFLEHGETLEEGAAREAEEEAGAAIRLDGILAVYSISRIGQVQVMFRARFDGPARFAPGDESLDVRLFSWDAVPWSELAFPSVRWALEAWRRSGDGPLAAPATNPASDPRGVNRITAEVAL
ncbi:MAG TPA: NUDIX hydrolase [Acetobacteraceae bacterium]|jgi:ADP-ribose pyrophosphatase YjhB (NUDIX family)|nr:NUDIX hydrolase [Acetobacteraceae bacterium]